MLGGDASRRFAKRVGRGIGSGKGKTAGRGHKGQRARSGTPAAFEGGLPLRKRLPKRGFFNPFSKDYHEVNLSTLIRLHSMQRLDVSQPITMKTLRDVGAINKKVKDGVKILAGGAEDLEVPLHLQVSAVTPSARAAIEQRGGSVSTVYYNDLGLRAVLKPESFSGKGREIPFAARPPPKQMSKFELVGALPAPATWAELEASRTRTVASLVSDPPPRSRRRALSGLPP